MIIILWPVGTALPSPRCSSSAARRSSGTPTPLSRHRPCSAVRPRFSTTSWSSCCSAPRRAAAAATGRPALSPPATGRAAVHRLPPARLVGQALQAPMHNHLYVLASFSYVVMFMSAVGVYLVQEIESAGEATVGVVIGVRGRRLHLARAGLRGGRRLCGGLDDLVPDQRRAPRLPRRRAAAAELARGRLRAADATWARRPGVLLLPLALQGGGGERRAT